MRPETHNAIVKLAAYATQGPGMQEANALTPSMPGTASATRGSGLEEANDLTQGWGGVPKGVPYGGNGPGFTDALKTTQTISDRKISEIGKPRGPDPVPGAVASKPKVDWSKVDTQPRRPLAQSYADYNKAPDTLAWKAAHSPSKFKSGNVSSSVIRGVPNGGFMGFPNRQRPASIETGRHGGGSQFRVGYSEWPTHIGLADSVGGGTTIAGAAVLGALAAYIAYKGYKMGKRMQQLKTEKVNFKPKRS